MKREVSPVLAVVGILVALTVVLVLYYRGLVVSSAIAAKPQGHGGGGGGEGGPPGLAEVGVNTLAGQTEAGYRDGPRQSALFDGPAAVAVGEDGRVYVADSGNQCIRVISRAGAVTTAAGRAGQAGYRDGPGGEARFSGPAGLAIARDGTLLVADTGNHRIRKVTAAGAVSLLAGAPTPRDELGREMGGYLDGPASRAEFRYPVGLAVDSRGAVFVADAGNHCVRCIEDGEVRTLPVAGGEMKSPSELVLIGDEIWVSDTAASMLWVGPQKGPLKPWQPSGEGGKVAKPAGLAVAAGDGGQRRLYVADAGSHCIRRIEEGGLSLVAGQGDPSPAGWQDGSGDTAQFSCPAGMTAGGDRAIYIADFGNNCIRSLWLTGGEGGAASGD